MGKLSADLLLRRESYLNPLKDREMDLRGASVRCNASWPGLLRSMGGLAAISLYKPGLIPFPWCVFEGHNIPAIENLGVTKNQLDSLDLSDNAITALSNLPHLPRLKHILLNNNPLTSISPNIARAVPNLQSLFLASTSVSCHQDLICTLQWLTVNPELQIQSIKDLTPLKSCPRLEFLSLRDAPVTRQPNYRSWLIFSCPSLRVIDFEKVKLKVSFLCPHTHTHTKGLTMLI